jgi:hypothetical protein
VYADSGQVGARLCSSGGTALPIQRHSFKRFLTGNGAATLKLATVRKLAMSLAEVTEEPHHNYGSFRVNGKTFITMPPGEEIIHIFVPDQVREQALIVYPSFVEKLLWGGKVRGLKVKLAKAQLSG